MKVYYLIPDKLERLREKVTENLEQYKNGKLKFVQANDLVRDTKIKFDDFKFDMSESKPSDSDYENIKIFYIALKDLKDSQAAEEILWAGLCHYSPFWDYLKYRWNCQTESEILTRYFFNDNARSIIMNGLARLWWYGRMTYDEKAKDPFELTKYICEKNLTLKGLLPLTFAFSNNKVIYRTYIRAIMEFENKYGLSQEEHEKIRREMVLWGGKFLLDSLNENELTKMINDYLNNLVKLRVDKKVDNPQVIKEKNNENSGIKKYLGYLTLQKNKKTKDKLEVECPKCKRGVKGKEDIGKYFGWRKSNGKVIPQSYCRECRTSKK